MDDSILNSVKKILGLGSDYTAFDADIIMDINSVFMVFNQEGIGPETPFTITGSDETWDDFIGESTNLESVKTLTAMKVRLMFDNITSSVVIESLNKQISELEWRLYSLNDYLGGTEDE